MDSEKVIDYRDKSMFDKRKVEKNAIQSAVPILELRPGGTFWSKMFSKRM